MGYYIHESVAQPFAVSYAAARLAPKTAFRGIIQANADGTIPDVAMEWWGADYSDQWGGSGGTPATPRLGDPADVGLVELWDLSAGGDAPAAPAHTFTGPITTAQGATFTVPGNLLTLGAWGLRPRLAPGAAEDALYGREQGTGWFIVVPHNDVITAPPHGTPTHGPAGELDPALLAVLGMPTRLSIRLHYTVGSDPTLHDYTLAELADQHAANAAILALLTTYWKPSDPDRTRPGPFPAKAIALNFPDYTGSANDKAKVASIVAMADYDGVDVFIPTNEIKPDNGHEGGVLSATNLTLQREFYDTVKPLRPTKWVGSASSVRFGPTATATLNGYIAAAAATGDPDAPFFDVLVVHDYPGSNGTPAFRRYFAALAAINWSGPVYLDEVNGVAAAQEGGGYVGRQARRVLSEMRERARVGLPTEVCGYFTSAPGGGFPWWLAVGPASAERAALRAAAALYVRRVALAGTSQIRESNLTHPNDDEDHLIVGSVYRHTTGGAQPAPSSNTGVVDVQGYGDPDAVVTFAITGTAGATLAGMNHRGEPLTIPVTGGRVTLDRDLLGDDGLVDGCYVFLPAGCNATVAAGPIPTLPGTDWNITAPAGTFGTTQIRRILDGPWMNRLADDISNARGDSASIWRSAQMLHAGQPLQLEFRSRTGLVHLREIKLVFAAPWQSQSTATSFVVTGRAGGATTGVLADVDVDVDGRVLDWRTDAAGLSSWQFSVWNDRHVFTLPCDAIVDGFDVVVTDATYGGSPTKNAANGFGRTTTDGKYDTDPEDTPATARDVETWDGPTLMGAGFAAPRWPGVQRVALKGTPAVLPAGPLQYAVMAPT